MDLLRRLRLKRNHRNEQRTQNNIIACRVVPADQRGSLSVKILDISPNGMAFAIKGACFDVGESVSIKFQHGLSPELSCDGEIVSQVIYYPGKTEDMKHAVFRFSVNLKGSLAPSIFIELQKHFVPTSEVA